MTPDDIVKLLERMGELLQPTARQVWDVYMRQAATEGVVWLVVGSILFLGGLALGIIGTYKNSRIQYHDGSDWLWLWLPSIFLILVSLIAIPSSIMEITNPAYYAIRKLLEILAN